MKTTNGPTIEYELVYTLLPKTIHTLHRDGKKRGHLIKSKSGGQVMYHQVEELMQFKCNARKTTFRD